MISLNHPIIYDKLDTSFLGYGVAILENATEVRIREVLNGEYTLDFALPINDSKWEYIVEENFVKVDGQLFVIRKIQDSRDDTWLSTVTCEHVFFLLLDDYIEDLTFVGNATAALTTVLDGTAHSVGIVDVVGDGELVVADQNPVKTINTMIDIWGGEIVADNWNISLLTHRGSAIPYVQFRYRKNLTSIKRTINTNGLITRLYVYGRDGLTIEGATSSGGKKYIDSQYINNYRRPKISSITFDTEDVEELYTLGQEYLASVEKPWISYEAEVVELKAIAEYGSLEEFAMGDEVSITDDDLRIDVQARVIEYERYPKEPWRSRVVLANFRPGIEQDISKLKEMKDQLITQDGSVKVSSSWLEGAIDVLKNQLIASGSYATAQVVDGKGMLFENTNVSSPDYGALYIGPGIFAIANQKTGSPPRWDWRTWGTGDGFTGNAILANTIKANCLVADQAMLTFLNAMSIVAGSVKAQNIDTTTAKITDAQIGTLSATKLTAGTIWSNLISILSADGNMTIAGNEIIMKHTNGTESRLSVSGLRLYDSGKILPYVTSIFADNVVPPVPYDPDMVEQKWRNWEGGQDNDGDFDGYPTYTRYFIGKYWKEAVNNLKLLLFPGTTTYFGYSEATFAQECKQLDITVSDYTIIISGTVTTGGVNNIVLSGISAYDFWYFNGYFLEVNGETVQIENSEHSTVILSEDLVTPCSAGNAYKIIIPDGVKMRVESWFKRRNYNNSYNLYDPRPFDYLLVRNDA